MRRGALFDSTGRYRYRLWRTWDRALPRVAFVMLNPSTADHRIDDPTIRRCIGFARQWGYGSLSVVNLFAYRSALPAALARVADPVGPDNDRHLRAACGRARDVVVAWGVHGRLLDRDRAVIELLARGRREPLLCLGTTRDGHPRHPLYLPRDIRPQPLRRAPAP
jgi:hypothetical protein